jgi:hypothetical protein
MRTTLVVETNRSSVFLLIKIVSSKTSLGLHSVPNLPITVRARWSSEPSLWELSRVSLLESSAPLSRAFFFLPLGCEVSVFLLHVKSDSLYLIQDFFIMLRYTYMYFIVHSWFHLHTPRRRDSLTAPAHLCHIPLIPLSAKPPLCYTWGIPARGNKPTNPLWPFKVTSVTWLLTTTAHLQRMGLLCGRTANI